MDDAEYANLLVKSLRKGVLPSRNVDTMTSKGYFVQKHHKNTKKTQINHFLSVVRNRTHDKKKENQPHQDVSKLEECSSEDRQKTTSVVLCKFDICSVF